MGDSRPARDYLDEKIDETHQDILDTIDELRGIFTRAGFQIASFQNPTRDDVKPLFNFLETAINNAHDFSDNPPQSGQSSHGNADNVYPPSSNPTRSLPQDDRRNPSHRENPLSHGRGGVNP